MKAKFATLYLLTLVLGHFNKTLSKSTNINRYNVTTSFNVNTGTWTTSDNYFITANTMLSKVTSLPKYLTRFTFVQVSGRKKSRRFREAQADKAHTSNVTAMRNVKKEDKFQSKLSPIGDYIFGSLLLISCKSLSLI